MSADDEARLCLAWVESHRALPPEIRQQVVDTLTTVTHAPPTIDPRLVEWFRRNTKAYVALTRILGAHPDVDLDRRWDEFSAMGGTVDDFVALTCQGMLEGWRGLGRPDPPGRPER